MYDQRIPGIPSASAGPGMTEIEDLSFRGWECFDHLACQREETRISVPITLGQSGSIRSTEMVEAENFDLVPNVTDFQDVDGKKTAFIIS